MYEIIVDKKNIEYCNFGQIIIKVINLIKNLELNEQLTLTIKKEDP